MDQEYFEKLMNITNDIYKLLSDRIYLYNNRETGLISFRSNDSIKFAIFSRSFLIGVM